MCRAIFLAQIIFTQTWPPLHLMFSNIISHSPSVTQKGYKVLIEDRPALSEGAAPPCGIRGP